MDLVVLVVGAEDVHADVHGQADGELALGVATGGHGLFPRSHLRAGERAADVVLGEEDLCCASAHDGIERLRTVNAALGARQQVERPKDDVVGAERDRSLVGEDARNLAARGRAERADLA